MEPVGLASGLAGLLTLGITVCQGLQGYYSSWKYADNNIARTLASVETLTKALVLVQSAVGHKQLSRDTLPHVEECIALIDKGIRSLQKKLDKVKCTSSQGDWQDKAKAGLRRALFPFRESTLAKLRELCSELRDDLSSALGVLQIDVSATSLEKLDFLGQKLEDLSMDVTLLKDRSTLLSEDLRKIDGTTGETAKSVDELVLHRNRKYAQKVLDWLSPLTVDFERKQHDTFRIHGRQDGVGQWLLETDEFNRWIRGSGQVLWCPGKRKLASTQARLNKSKC